jgi:hypothetical protein
MGAESHNKDDEEPTHGARIGLSRTMAEVAEDGDEQMKSENSLNRIVDEVDSNATCNSLGDEDHDMRISLSVSRSMKVGNMDRKLIRKRYVSVPHQDH